MSSVGHKMSFADALNNQSNKPMVTKKPNPVNPRDLVPFWWDFENLPIDMKDLPKLIDKIEPCLQSRDAQLKLDSVLHVVGNFDVNVQTTLERAGFTVTETRKYALTCRICNSNLPFRKGCKPKRYERVKEVAERIIVQGFIKHILDDTGSKNVMVISGDSDFALPLDILRDSDYKH